MNKTNEKSEKNEPAAQINFKIVVPSFNCPDWIERCLASIESQKYPVGDVCVIDDASTLPGPLNDFKLVPEEVVDVSDELRKRPVYATL
ncbi:MAG: glycosyltransferase [Parachlamydiaceae bacterium]|nr:glycosyltransferase [Parachlamydiaceae bacterium]